MKILLDTNAYSALMRGDEETAASVRRSEQILLSAVVAAELLFGFRLGGRQQKNLDELDVFLSSPRVGVVTVNLTTADRFARIAATLRKKGRPIPTNDIWIAAHTMETGAELISFDSHFSEIDGLVWRRLAAV